MSEIMLVPLPRGRFQPFDQRSIFHISMSVRLLVRHGDDPAHGNTPPRNQRCGRSLSYSLLVRDPGL